MTAPLAKLLLFGLPQSPPHPGASLIARSVGKESACSAGDSGSVPELGSYPGEGNGNPLQYSCLENPMDRGAWQAAVHGVPRVRHELPPKPPSP